MKEIKLTERQEEAIEKISFFLSDKCNETRFCLHGAAGTGKTTILNNILQNIPFGKKIALTAPTHKAVNIFSKMMFRKGVTLHSLMGLRPNLLLEDFDNNNPIFSQLKTPKIQEYNILIHDETSMLGLNLDMRLVNLAKTHNVKILYVGDRYQLPPVKQGQTDAFNTYLNIELIDIVRQEKGNPLLELFSIIRDDVKNGTFNFYKYLQKNPIQISIDENGNQIGYKVTREYEDMLEGFDNISENPDKYRYLAYTNQNVSDANEYIRNNILNEENILAKKDVLTSYTTLVDEENFFEPIVTNSSDYIVTDIEPYVNNYGIDGFTTTIKDCVTERQTNIFIANHANLDSFKDKYFERYNNLRNIALNSQEKYEKAKNWKKFYEFKDFNLTMTNISQNGKLIGYKDIDYGYGLTVHKSQGSTYDNICVNLRNIMYGNGNTVLPNRDMMIKMIYVAMSRARRFVTIKI